MQNLKTFIDSNGPMPWATCAKAFAQLLAREPNQESEKLALPLNLYSFQIDESTNEISLWQSPSENDFAYQSPEFCLERPTDERSVVYSLGCVLYACMTGAPPFVDKSGVRLSELQVSEEPRPVSKRILNESLPVELDALIDKAMRKNPKKRFADSKTLGLELEKLQGNPILYKPNKQSVSKFLALFALAPVISFSLSHNSYTQKLIADSHPQARHPYHLSIDSSDYRLQMEFDDNKIEPDKSKKQIQIINLMTKKIMFATTKRKNFKEAVEEAVRRQLDLKGADFSGQDLSGANLHGAKFAKAFFIGSKLNNVNFYSCFLDGADFRDATMNNCMLGDVHAVQANFSGANLSGSQMQNSFFLQSNFMDANLSRCDLTNAKLNQAKMVRADLTGAITKGANRNVEFWDGAKVTDAQLKDTITLQSAK